MPAVARVEAWQDDGSVLARLSGEVDLSNVAIIERELDAAVTGSSAVVIDLTPVEYMDSQGVRLLHALAARLGEDGVPTTLVAPKDSVAGHLVALTGLGEVVGVRESLER